jgi:cytochrome c-type biogenesis protein CcmH/NrfF
MNCEEFEIIGMDAERDPSLSAEQREAAAAHQLDCPRCASLQESWASALGELREFAAATGNETAPNRVEMRLRWEFRSRHQAKKTRSIAGIVSWALASAALLIGAVSWHDWRTRESRNAPPVSVQSSSGGGQDADTDAATLLASNDSGFTQLPGALMSEGEETSVVRVSMPRSALSSLGLPVNEESASEWIQVDLLVTDDGDPQAIRLPQ